LLAAELLSLGKSQLQMHPHTERKRNVFSQPKAHRKKEGHLGTWIDNRKSYMACDPAILLPGIYSEESEMQVHVFS
jgi:hypothetical protein